MTVENLLATVDAMNPNEICDDVKIRWICDVEGMILTEIHKKRAEEIALPKSGCDNLTLPEAFASVYLLYISSMVEFSKGNYEAFIRINGEFVRAFSAYARYYIRNRG